MQLRSKLLLSSALVVVVLSLAGGGLGLFYTHHVARISMAVVEEDAIPILEIQRMEKSVLEIWQRMLLHASVTDEEVMSQVEEELPLLEQALQHNIGLMSEGYLHNDAELSQYWWMFHKQWQDFSEAVAHLLQLSIDSRKKRALQEMLDGDGWQSYQSLIQSLDALIGVHRQRMEAMRDNARSARTEALIVLVGLISGVGLTVFYLLRRLSSRYLIEPLIQLDAQLSHLAEGRITATRLDYRSCDEIGAIADAARRLQAALGATIAQADSIAQGNYDTRIDLLSDEDELGRAVAAMTEALHRAAAHKEAQDWLKNGHRELSRHLSGEQAPATLAKNVLDFLVHYVNAQAGLFYLAEQNQGQPLRLKLFASHAHRVRKHLADEFGLGEGLVGQAALEKKSIIVEQVADGYLPIAAGVAECIPRNILLLPLLYETELKGVLELASVHEFKDSHLEFLHQAMPPLAVAVNTAQSHLQMSALLEQTRRQTETLQNQAEELQAQQEELRQSNDELEHRSHLQEQQKQAIEETNQGLQKTRAELESKARELERASHYKSEFLANMSHELRTPLNSLLILAHLLSQNKDGNLTAKQVDQLQTIHHAGTDLLNLINDVLDLSKVEAGKLEIQVDRVPLPRLIEQTRQRFMSLAQGKGLEFVCTCAEQVPQILDTDHQRLKQILANLLSNAIKFTEQGSVSLSVGRPRIEEAENLDLDPARTVVFEVRDTGIGIPAEKQEMIFEAFQQAEGSIELKYGGTGLGLSISRQLARLLGGEIVLHSAENQGSTFSLYLPQSLSAPTTEDSTADSTLSLPESAAPTTDADKFARSLSGVEARSLSGVEARSLSGVEAQGLEFTDEPTTTVPPVAQQETPEAASSIPLTPEFDAGAGNTPPNVPPAPVTAPRETASPATTPVAAQPAITQSTVVPADDNNVFKGRKILIVDDDMRTLYALTHILEARGIQVAAAKNGDKALELLEQENDVHLVLMDIMMPGIDGYETMRRIRAQPRFQKLPIIALTAKTMHDDRAKCLEAGANEYLAKPLESEKLLSLLRVWLFS